jgi:NAD(P)H dehydrogenase (quinone)
MGSGGETHDRVSQHIALVDAAAAAGAELIVYLPFLGAAPKATFTFAQDHRHTEERIHSTGLRHTFLRHSLYMDLLPAFAVPTASSADLPATGGWERWRATTSRT